MPSRGTIRWSQRRSLLQERGRTGVAPCCRRTRGTAAPQSLRAELEDAQVGASGLGWHRVGVPGPEQRPGPWPEDCLLYLQAKWRGDRPSTLEAAAEPSMARAVIDA
jgi:hypothetical protein